MSKKSQKPSNGNGSEDDLVSEELELTLNMLSVEGVAGAQFDVMTVEEALWFETNRDRYLEEYRFENNADLQDLDRLLGLELLSYRYASWAIKGTGFDYANQMYDEKVAREQKQKIDQEIRLIKKHMGMDRKGRIGDEQESVSEYLKNLLHRAEDFGVHRDNQIAKAIDLFNELKKLVGLYERTDERERAQLSVNMEDIFGWIRDIAIPEYDAIDDAFRKNQRLWHHEVA
jgi:hypothetical protein